MMRQLGSEEPAEGAGVRERGRGKHQILIGMMGKVKTRIISYYLVMHVEHLGRYGGTDGMKGMWLRWSEKSLYRQAKATFPTTPAITKKTVKFCHPKTTLH